MFANVITNMHKANYNDDTNGSKLINDFPTITVKKHQYLLSKDIEAVFFPSLHIIILRNEKLIGFPCYCYVMLEDEIKIKSACYNTHIPFAVSAPNEDIYNEIRSPIVLVFDEDHQTLNLMVHEFSGLRTIAYTASIMRKASSDAFSYSIIPERNEILRILDIASAYYKRIEDINRLTWIRDIEKKEQAFRSIARFILGHAPAKEDINCISEYADNLEDLVKDIRNLAVQMTNYRISETPCEKEYNNDDE